MKFQIFFLAEISFFSVWHTEYFGRVSYKTNKLEYNNVLNKTKPITIHSTTYGGKETLH